MDGNKSKMVKALGSSEEAVFLQNRLDDMNQRWSDLKAKSANIRSVNLHSVATPQIALRIKKHPGTRLELGQRIK